MYCVDVNRSTTSERSTVRGAPARRARTCYDMMFQHHESDHGVARGGAQDPLVDSRWSTVCSCRRSSSRSSAACQPAAHAAPIMSRAGSCRSTPVPSPSGSRSTDQPPLPIISLWERECFSRGTQAGVRWQNATKKNQHLRFEAHPPIYDSPRFRRPPKFGPEHSEAQRPVAHGAMAPVARARAAPPRGRTRPA